MFNHVNLGTFTNDEWASGGQSPAKFAPSSVDCTSWAAAAAATKMSGSRTRERPGLEALTGSVPHQLQGELGVRTVRVASAPLSASGQLVTRNVASLRPVAVVIWSSLNW